MPYRSSTLNANLTKAAAATGDVLRLLRLWNPDRESPAEFQRRSVDENLLGKASRSRVDDVSNVLARRYFPGGEPQPGRRLRELAESHLSRDVLDRLLYYHAALAEPLLYRAATEFVYGQRLRGAASVTTAAARRFIAGLDANGGGGYSPAVLDKLAQASLTALRDFGIFEGRARKRIAPIRVPPEVVGYVAYALKDEGLSAKRIVEHTDWRLFLLHPREAEDRIADVGGYGYFSYHAAGDIRRFDWSHDSLDEYVDAITGRAHPAA